MRSQLSQDIEKLQGTTDELNDNNWSARTNKTDQSRSSIVSTNNNIAHSFPVSSNSNAASSTNSSSSLVSSSPRLALSSQTHNYSSQISLHNSYTSAKIKTDQHCSSPSKASLTSAVSSPSKQLEAKKASVTHHFPGQSPKINGDSKTHVLNCSTKSQESLSSESSTTTIGSIPGVVRSKHSRSSGAGSRGKTVPPNTATYHTQPADSSTVQSAPGGPSLQPSSTLPSYPKNSNSAPSSQSATSNVPVSEAAALNLSSSLSLPRGAAPNARELPQRSGRSSRSPSHHYHQHFKDASGHPVAGYPPEFYRIPRKESGRGIEYHQDAYTMPYMYHGHRTPMMSSQGYYIEPGTMQHPRHHHRRGVPRSPLAGSRYPPGYYPIDNTHQLILHKVELLNKQTRRKFLLPSVPSPGSGQNPEDQFGNSFNIQEYASPDNSEHAATLSSESERSHRSHHVDDDQEESQRRVERNSIQKQNSSGSLTN